MKTFSSFEKRAILNVAQSVKPLRGKIQTLGKKINDLNIEKTLLLQQIENIENTIKPFTEGYSSNDLVEAKVINNVTKYTFKYPDTILPVLQNPIITDTQEMNADTCELPNTYARMDNTQSQDDENAFIL